jgi:Ca2+-binding RTX toxin-like protein
MQNDYLMGEDGNDAITGLRGNDVLWGRGGDDNLSGGRGRDFLLGGDGDDTLDGGRGLDLLIGGEGDDILIGGAGSDFLLGGAGADTFMVTSDRGVDRIFDFNADEGDVINVADLLGDVGYEAGVEGDALDNYLRVEGNDLLIQNDDGPSCNGADSGWDRVATADFGGQSLQDLLDNNSIITETASV